MSSIEGRDRYIKLYYIVFILEHSAADSGIIAQMIVEV